MIKKNKNKNYLLIMGAIIITLIVLFFGYKLFMYYRYTADKPDDVEEIVNGLKNYKTINIKKRTLNEDEYIVKKHFKMKNIMEGYTLDQNNINKDIDIYRKEIDDKKYVIQFASDIDSFQIIDGFVDDNIQIFGDESLGFLKGNITDADRDGFLEKNNIKNDIDFYKFVANNYFIESNLFTDTKTLKQNYAFNLFTSIVVPRIDKWVAFEGDLTGYIMYIGTKSDVSVYQIAIIDNGKRYGILTTDPRFIDEEFTIDFISSIEIV